VRDGPTDRTIDRATSATGRGLAPAAVDQLDRRHLLVVDAVAALALGLVVFAGAAEHHGRQQVGDPLF
jgi:hypothetical protein